MHDPISDLLTRIRNAGLAQHAEVVIPHSKMKESIMISLKNMPPSLVFNMIFTLENMKIYQKR